MTTALDLTEKELSELKELTQEKTHRQHAWR